MHEQKKLFRMIQQVSFVLYETALYLDTHPHCRQALAYFNKYNARLRELMENRELEYVQNGNRRLIADEAIWKWYEQAKTPALAVSGKRGE